MNEVPSPEFMQRWWDEAVWIRSLTRALVPRIATGIAWRGDGDEIVVEWSADPGLPMLGEMEAT